MADKAKSPGSADVGWRAFPDRCTGCHGPAAARGAAAPDLLLVVRAMGSRQFVGIELKRYDWDLPGAQAKSQGAAPDSLIDDVVQRRTRDDPTSNTPAPVDVTLKI